MLGRVVGTDFFPQVDVGIMKLHYRAPVGLRIEETEKLVLQVEDEIRKIIPPAELATINDMVGVPIFFNLAFVPTDNISGMDAEILISLKEPHRPVAEYMREIRSKIPPKFPGSSFYFQAADIVTQVLNFGLPAPIDVQVQDFNFERGQLYAGRLRKAIEEVPGAVDVRQLQVLNYPGLRVDVDRLRAARLGFTQRDVANSLLTTLSSSSLVNPSYFLAPERRELRGGGANADRKDRRRGRSDGHVDHCDDCAGHRRPPSRRGWTPCPGRPLPACPIWRR